MTEGHAFNVVSVLMRMISEKSIVLKIIPGLTHGQHAIN